jgi:hypothetical protein
VIDDGRNGFLVTDVQQAADAVGRLDAIDRATCRGLFEERFSAKRMAMGYLSLYQASIATNRGIADASA